MCEVYQKTIWEMFNWDSFKEESRGDYIESLQVNIFTEHGDS